MSEIIASRFTYLEQTTSAYRTSSVEPDAPARWGGYDLVAAAALLGKQSPSLQVPALPSLEIYEIQGAGHVSAHVGATVSTQGIITAIDRGGFWLQPAVGDGDSATSDAIFVRHSVAGVAVGDAITVTGVVGEQARGPGLTITEISAQTVSVHSHGNALPEAILIGVNGILPPTSVIEDDSLGSYDPETDGLDFWESLEGMRVTLETPQAISNTNTYGETYLVASHGAGATGMTIRGGLAIGEGDWNPEQIQLDDRLYDQPYLTVGDQLASVTGILGYGYNHYELVATERAVVTRDAVLTRETADFSGDANHLTVATYDLSNLDPYDARFASVANDIVNRLQSPDVIAVQRVQDADGRGTGTDLSGHATADRLIEAIFQQTGLRYDYVEIAPDEINSTAGQENGNVRNGYLYRPDRVELVEGSLQVIDHAIFDGTRSPLVATWSFNGEEVTTINVHFTTRYGSDPLWGAVQDPYHAGTIMRTNQIAAVDEYIEAMLAADPDANVMLTGSFGGFTWEAAQRQLTDDGLLTNLTNWLDAGDRYTSIVDGNTQQLHHTLLSGGLLSRAEYDIVHLNSEFAGLGRNSANDPQITRFYIPNAPDNLRLAGNSVVENAAAGTVVGRLVADDTLGDRLTYELLDDAGGLFGINAATGVITTTAPLNFEELAQYNLEGRVTDTAGLSTSGSFTVSVLDANETPVAADDSLSIVEGGVANDLAALLLGNDADPDGGALHILSVDTAGTTGRVEFDPETQSLRYFARGGAIDELAQDESLLDTFTYTVVDANGATHTARLTITVDGAVDGVTLYGGNGNDVLHGSEGDDFLYGGNGTDTLIGYGGDDWLEGGRGNDILTGGEGSDIFVIEKAGGHDFVTDFDVHEDMIYDRDDLRLKAWWLEDYDNDGTLDLTLMFNKGTKITLANVWDMVFQGQGGAEVDALVDQIAFYHTNDAGAAGFDNLGAVNEFIV